METAVFVGKFNYKLLKGDSRRLSAIPASTAVSMPYSYFKESSYIYLITGCTPDLCASLLDLLVFCKAVNSTAVLIISSPPRDVKGLLDRNLVCYFTKQPKWFLRKFNKNLTASVFATPDTVVRYDSIDGSITVREL